MKPTSAEACKIKALLCLIIFCLAAPISPSLAGSNPAQVKQILAVEMPQQSSEITPELQRQINYEAEKELMAFVNSTDGCSIALLPLTDQRWKKLRTHIYNDFVAHASELYLAPETEKYRRSADIIADRMQQADVDAIYAFYQSPKGQRYQRFRQKIDAMMDKLWRQDMVEEQKQKQPNMEDALRMALDAERHKDIMDHGAMMSFYSKWMVEIVTSGQTDLGPGIGGMIGQTMAMKHPDEFEALYNEYKNDFDDFKTFRLGAPYENFFKIFRESLSVPVPYKNSFDQYNANLAPLRAEWKNYCLTLTGAP